MLEGILVQPKPYLVRMVDSMNNAQRLRTSCDRCQNAKVKCSRAKPACWRCNQSGQQCVYSPVRRTGRPKTSSASCTSVQGDREEASRQQNEAQKEHNNSGWYQRQQQHEDYPFLAALAEGALSGEINTEHPQSQLWQPGPIVGQPDLSRPIDSVQKHPNDLVLDFQTCEFDIQDITPDFEVFDANPTLEETASERNMPGYSSITSFPGWSSDLWNCSTADNASPDRPTPSPTAMPFPGEMSLPRGDFGSKLNAATDPNTSLTTDSNQAGQRPGLSLHLTNQPPTVLNPNTHSRYIRPPPTPIESTTSSESTMPGLTQASNHPGPRHSSKCYKALSEVLARLNDDSPESEGVSLDKLFGLDRELHRTIKIVLACRRCMERSSNQTMIMMMFMALDTLLCLFEKQQDAATAHTAVPKLPSWRALATTRGATGEGNSRTPSQFPWVDKALLVGSFAVDDKVKTIFLRQLVLAFVGNLSSVLSELERQADRVLKGVNCRIAKEIAVDICRRALFLRGWLRLAS